MFEILNVLITPMSWYNGTYTIGNRIVENGTVKLNTTLKKMKKKRFGLIISATLVHNGEGVFDNF